MSVNAEATPTKQRGKPFPKGVSGNPSGRPAGSRNRVTEALQTILEGEGERITRKAVELALEGNLVAIKLCLERLIPAQKQVSLDVTTSQEQVHDTSDILGKLKAAQVAYSSGPAPAQPLAVEVVDIDQERTDT